jgi:hypothetical protein
MGQLFAEIALLGILTQQVDVFIHAAIYARLVLVLITVCVMGV